MANPRFGYRTWPAPTLFSEPEGRSRPGKAALQGGSPSGPW